MGQERRAYPRRPVHWEATVAGDGLTEQAMTIRDFCAGGLFLEPPAEEPPWLQADDLPATIRIRFQDPSSGTHCQCDAHLVRATSTGLAVSFDGPRLDVVTILSAVAQGQSEPQAGSLAQAPEDAFRREVIDLTRRQATAFAERVLPVFAGHAIDELGELTREASGTDEQETINECHMALRLRENDLTSVFVSRLGERISELTQRPTAPASEGSKTSLPESIDELELVDTDDFEDWLNRSEIVSQAEHRFAGELERLTRRLGYVVGHRIDEGSNPLEPSALSEILVDSLPVSHPPVRVKRTLYRLIGTHILERLGEFYSELNAALRQRSILPDLENERPEIRSLGGSQRARWFRRPEIDALGQGDALFTDSRPSNRSAQLLAERLGSMDQSAPDFLPVGGVADANTATPPRADASSAPAPGGTEEAGSATSADGERPSTAGEGEDASRWLGLQQTLRSVREAAAQRPVAPSPEPSPAAQHHQRTQSATAPPVSDASEDASAGVATDTLGELLRYLDTDQLDDLPQDLRDRVEVIADWFEDIAANAVNPQLLRDWSRSLAIVALARERQAGEFLSNARHDIHDFLDQWDRAALALAATPAEHRSGLQRRIETLLGWVCQVQSKRPEVIADAASQISTLVDAPLEARAANLQRITEQHEGSKRLEKARSQVSQALDERFAGRRIPAALDEFLRDYWHHILVLVRLRSGVDSEHWQRALAAVDRLVTMLGSGDQPAKPVPDHEKVFAFMEKQLTAFGRSSEECEALIKRMKARAGPVCAGQEPVEPPSLVRVVPFSGTEAEDENADPYWLGLAKLLQPGQWLAESNSEGESRALRLQWVDDERSRFVFADHTGNTPITYRRGELAHGLEHGQLRLTEDLDASLSQRQWHRKIAASHDAVIELATHDAATGLLNRKALVRELQRVEERYRGGRQNHALVCFHFADLDLGASDKSATETAEQIARRLAAKLGPHDLIGRTDTDSFVLFLADRTTARAEIVAEELRRELEDASTLDNGSYRVSVGLIGFQFGGLQSPMRLLQDAEAACTEVMASGGGRIETIRADERDLAALRDNMQRAVQLDAALAAGNLQLRAQRIQAIAYGDTAPLPLREILIAVGSGEDTEQLLSPAQFIPAAERFGRMASVDRWVIRHVLEWCRDNPRQAAGAKAFTINLAGATLHDIELVDYLHAEFARTGVAPEKVCFELSETLAVQNLARTADLVTGVRQLGCHFALDDVGTGKDAHAYLGNLPVDYIKIDGGFIRHIATDETDAAMVRSINDLAHHLGKTTIAEYVENEAILERLEAIGVDYVQGYGIGYPEPLATLPLV